MSSFEKMFEPIKIGGVEIKNRIAMAPMNTMFSYNNSGYVTEEVLAHYAARAKGGFGLIITECVLGTKLASRFPAHSNLHLFNESHVPGLVELVETVHAFGAKIFIQLSIGFGRAGHSHTGEPSPAPSALPLVRKKENCPKAYWEILSRHPEYSGGDSVVGEVPREITLEEILNEEKEFANSAKLAVQCGFDGLEIHGCHGYLEFQFLSPLSNRRTDLYGGNLENRMRLLVNTVDKTIKSTRSLVPDFPVQVRLSADEHLPGGTTYEETRAVVKRVAEVGASSIHLSDGSHEAFKWMFPEKDGTMLDEAAGFKRITDIPVMTPSVHNPELAELAIAQGKTDLVSFGRQALTDPDWPNKVSSGKAASIKKCTRCNYCILRFRAGLPIRCLHNPNLGSERYMSQYWRPAVLKGDAVLPVTMRRRRNKSKVELTGIQD